MSDDPSTPQPHAEPPPEAVPGAPADREDVERSGRQEVPELREQDEPDSQAVQEPPSQQDIAADRPVLEPTGDAAVDEVLEQFDRVTGEPLATQIEAAEHIHTTLDSRLSDLGES